MLAVDSSHPAVKELMLAGFTEAQSMSAIEECRTLKTAIQYLISQSGGSQMESENEASKKTADESFKYDVEHVVMYMLIYVYT